MPDRDIELRFAAIERRLDNLSRPRGGNLRARDGRAVLSVRIGDELAAAVRLAARQRGCTIADLLRPAILAAVNQPSTGTLAELPSERGWAAQPRRLAVSTSPVRDAICSSLAERGRLRDADAATMADRRSRDQRAAGWLTDSFGGKLSLRGR